LESKSVKFFEIYNKKDMLNAKTSFGHFTTNSEIFIAGGSTRNEYSLKQVESYDIKKDIWLKQPDLN